MLVAEDNVVNQFVCTKMLTSLGVVTYRLVANGELAIMAAAEKDYDVVLMVGGSQHSATLHPQLQSVAGCCITAVMAWQLSQRLSVGYS